MVIRYTPPLDIDISSDVNGYRNLLEAYEKETWLYWPLHTGASVETAPYERTLRKLIIREGKDKVITFVEGENLLIEGKKNYLDVFFDNIRFLIQDGHSTYNEHLHIEYYDDHLFLSESSLPLVIGIS